MRRHIRRVSLPRRVLSWPVSRAVAALEGMWRGARVLPAVAVLAIACSLLLWVFALVGDEAFLPAGPFLQGLLLVCLVVLGLVGYWTAGRPEGRVRAWRPRLPKVNRGSGSEPSSLVSTPAERLEGLDVRSRHR